jgi:hypothetical protein
VKSTFFGTGLALIVASATIFARDNIRVYTVPKEAKPAAAETLPPMAHQHAAGPQTIIVASIPRNEQTWFFKLKGDPQTVEAAKSAFQEFLKSVEFTDSTETPAKWKAPEGWAEKPAGDMVLGSFSIPGKDGGKADLTITSFPGNVGGELMNVNRWRGQVGLEPVSELPKAEQVTVSGVQGKLYVFAAGPSATTANPHAEASTPVDSADPHAGLNIPPVNGASDPHAGLTTGAADSDGPQMDVPAGWKKKAASPMVLKSYTVTGSKGGTATVSISSFPGDVGGRRGNINRWRTQLGQQDVDASQVDKASQDFEAQGGKGYLVDVDGTDARSGKPARLVAVAVLHDGNTWFYKLLGDKSTVEESKESFLKFVKTVRY